MRADDLDFILPPELIAQEPAERRDASRLMHYRTQTRQITHRQFAEFPSLLRDGDLLVFNNARVVPARFAMQKKTGGQIEGLFLSQLPQGEWMVMLKNFGSSPVGTEMTFTQSPEISAKFLRRGDDGEYILRVETGLPAFELLNQLGRMPLPPYIHRAKVSDPRDAQDQQRYQTVFAKASGSVAAPTAGLHFTPEILDQLRERGVQSTFITLHVGMGTFKPVSAETLDQHTMHAERYEIESDAADILNRAESEGRRIIAVGTTAARVLESWPAHQPWETKTGETAIFIYPPYTWKRVAGLFTNFHLPKSTLIALVAAFIGLDEQRRLYAQAIKEHYRFFSFGDAMFLEE